jgi:hypothetical protein
MQAARQGFGRYPPVLAGLGFPLQVLTTRISATNKDEGGDLLFIKTKLFATLHYLFLYILALF